MSHTAIFANPTAIKASAANTLEVYLCFSCPFSKKAFDRIVKEVMPYAEQAYPGKLKFQFRHQIQSWHPQATVLHEAAIAVHKIDSGKFIQFCDILFQHQQQYFDANCQDMSRVDMYKDLIKLAETIGIDGKKMNELLTIVNTDVSKNYGNATTNDLKIALRIARQNHIHVSPTYLWNGLIDEKLESSTDLDAWKQYLAARL